MRLVRIAAALLLTGVLVVQPQAGQAAANFPRIDAAGFAVVSGTTFPTYGARIAALEADPRLAPVGLTAVLDAANRTGRPLCHPTFLDPALNPQGFCWQDGEDDDANVWIPQGVTGSGDAQPSGTVGGRRVVAATWHYADDSAIRVSFLDLATLKYRHVLLVEPVEHKLRRDRRHGHGLFWYRDKLVVATGGSVLRVFDLDHLWATNASTGEVGLGTDGRYRARSHAYALPQSVPGYAGGGCAYSA